MHGLVLQKKKFDAMGMHFCMVDLGRQNWLLFEFPWFDIGFRFGGVHLCMQKCMGGLATMHVLCDTDRGIFARCLCMVVVAHPNC